MRVVVEAGGISGHGPLLKPLDARATLFSRTHTHARTHTHTQHGRGARPCCGQAVLPEPPGKL